MRVTLINKERDCDLFEMQSLSLLILSAFFPFFSLVLFA